MSKDLRLADAELDAVVAAVPWTDGPTLRWAKTNRAVANAATDKALRGVVAWLREQHALAGNQPCYLSEFADLLEEIANYPPGVTGNEPQIREKALREQETVNRG